MKENTPLMNLMEAASVANMVHFPQGVAVWRCSNGGWAAKILGKDDVPKLESTSVNSGATPEAAIESVRVSIVKRLKDAAESANREGDSKRAAIRLVEAAQ